MLNLLQVVLGIGWPVLGQNFLLRYTTA